MSLSSTGLVAHKGATGLVKERMDAMAEMGDATKAIAAMVKGEVEMDRAAIVAAAQVLVEHGDKIVEQFPVTSRDSHSDVSEALPEIWDDFARFETLAIEMTNRSEELKSLANSGAERKALDAGFRSVAKSCKTCHRDFRKPQ